MLIDIVFTFDYLHVLNQQKIFLISLLKFLAQLRFKDLKLLNYLHFYTFVKISFTYSFEYKNKNSIETP